MSNNHRYKIGQKVRHIGTGLDYFVIGIKTSSLGMTSLNEARLIVYEDKNQPSRNGKVVWPCHVELIE